MAESLNNIQQYYIQPGMLPAMPYNNANVYVPVMPNIKDVYSPAVLPAVVVPPNIQDTFSPRYRELQSFTIPFNNNLKGKFYQLSNGQKVVIVQKPGPTTIKTLVRAGGFNETERIRGISHFIEHSLFDGSDHLGTGEFHKLTHRMGTYTNASTGTDGTEYYIESGLCDKKDLAKLINIHADMIQHPTFPDKPGKDGISQIEKEKDVIAQEIQFRKNNLNEKTHSLMLNNLFNVKSPADILVAGTEQNVRNLTRQNLVDYYNKWYTPDNMTTIIVGDVDPDQTIKMVADEFGKKPSVHNDSGFYQPLVPINKTVRQNIEWPNISSVNLHMGLVGPKNNDLKEKMATGILLFALAGYKNSRLTKALKPFNTDCNTYMYSSGSKPDDPKHMGLICDFMPGDEEKALRVIDKTFDEVESKPIGEEELSLIKNMMKYDYRLSNESSTGIADNISEIFTDNENLDTYLAAPELIDTITAKDIQDVARKYLRADKSSIVMTYPKGQLPKDHDKLETFQNKAKDKVEKYFNTAKTQIMPLILIGGRLFSYNPINNNQIWPNSPLDTNNKEKTNVINMNQVKQIDLKNNLHAYIYDNPDPAIAASSSLAFRSRSLPPSKPGVSELLNIMLSKGTRRFSEESTNYFKYKNNLDVIPVVGIDGFATSVHCPNEKLPMALNLAKEILLDPDLSQENFEKCKQEFQVMLAGMEEVPEERANEVLWGNHPLGYSTRMVKENIDKITLQDIKDFYNHVINNKQGTFSIAGDFSKTPGIKENVISVLETRIPNLNKYQPIEVKTSPIKETIVLASGNKGKKQAEILQMFRVPDADNLKEQAALSVMTEILGGSGDSRLYQDLREKQELAYAVYSNKSEAGSDKIINLKIETSMEDIVNGKQVPKFDNMKKSLEGFKKHIELIKNEPVTQEELDSAKEQIRNSIFNYIELSSGKNSCVEDGFNSKYGPDYLNKYKEAVRKVTREEVLNVAKKYLGQPSITSIVASPEAIDANKDYLKTLGNLTVY